MSERGLDSKKTSDIRVHRPWVLVKDRRSCCFSLIFNSKECGGGTWEVIQENPQIRVKAEHLSLVSKQKELKKSEYVKIIWCCSAPINYK